MTGDNKGFNRTECLVHKGDQTFDIRLGKEMVAGPHGFIPYLEKFRYALICPLNLADNGWACDSFAYV